MDRKLFFAIEDAENEFCRITDLEQAIIALSTRDAATSVLINAICDAAVNHEKAWSKIETMHTFKAIYGDDRKKAREDFLHEINQRHF